MSESIVAFTLVEYTYAPTFMMLMMQTEPSAHLIIPGAQDEHTARQIALQALREDGHGFMECRLLRVIWCDIDGNFIQFILDVA